MSYFKVLGLEREPFSTSPDPLFFYQSKEHKTSLTSLLIELHLKRGLSVILGDVGTGKTTLSRKLVQSLKERDGFEFHMIFDPTYESEQVFLSSLIRLFGITGDIQNVRLNDVRQTAEGGQASRIELKEALQRFLFQKVVEQYKTVVLIIDEAQKLDTTSLEVLRVLLNYETNEYKLLQLVLFGQLELHSKIMTMANFIDRISFKYTLNPLDEDEMSEMINFRIKQAGYQGKISLFQEDALKEIYRYTKGYPRQVNLLCHKVLKNVVIKSKAVVDPFTVREIIDSEIRNGWMPIRNNASA
jgi:general secretion pathway protein A